jgi:hypothetical protein
MLSINSLHDELIERQNKKNRIYEDVLEKIITKIKYVNSKSNECYLVYTLKNFIYGIPLYNINECGNYLQKRLSDAGFVCKYNQKNNIYISWKSRPVKEKVLITHQYTQPRITSVAYPDLSNKPLALTNEPNMLKMKKQPGIQQQFNTKQQQFSELDKQFLNMDINGFNNAFSHNVVSNNQGVGQSQQIHQQQHRPIIQPNYHQGNQLFKNDITAGNSNIKAISYNVNKGSNKNINIPGIKGVSSSEANNLDEFLGTLM